MHIVSNIVWGRSVGQKKGELGSCDEKMQARVMIGQRRSLGAGVSGCGNGWIGDSGCQKRVTVVSEIDAPECSQPCLRLHGRYHASSSWMRSRYVLCYQPSLCTSFWSSAMSTKITSKLY